MARIKIDDLQQDLGISHEDMRRIHGGGLLSWAQGLVDDAQTFLFKNAIATTSSATEGASSGAKIEKIIAETK